MTVYDGPIPQVYGCPQNGVAKISARGLDLDDQVQNYKETCMPLGKFVNTSAADTNVRSDNAGNSIGGRTLVGNKCEDISFNIFNVSRLYILEPGGQCRAKLMEGGRGLIICSECKMKEAQI